MVFVKGTVAVVQSFLIPSSLFTTLQITRVFPGDTGSRVYKKGDMQRLLSHRSVE